MIMQQGCDSCASLSCGPWPCMRLSRTLTTTATLTPLGCLGGFRSVFPTPYFRSPSHHPKRLPSSHGWTLRDRVGGGYHPTSPASWQFPSGHGVDQVHPCHPSGHQFCPGCQGEPRETNIHAPPLAVPSGTFLRQGTCSPSVETHFARSLPVVSQPSPASWWLASHRTGTFQGHAAHMDRASCHASPQWLTDSLIEPVGISSHSIHELTWRTRTSGYVLFYTVITATHATSCRTLTTIKLHTKVSIHRNLLLHVEASFYMHKPRGLYI
jgi:hypothetical protein